MNGILVRFAILPLLAIVLAEASLAAQQYPAEPGDGVADMAGIIDPADADSLRRMLAALRTDAGVEVRVLTVKNIARYGTNDATPEAFATAVYNDWKLGYGQAQDGVLVMVSVDDRFARIELGDGVPVHQDARMQSIMDTDMVPHFRLGDYDRGIMNGVRAIAASFRESGFATAPLPVGGFSDPPSAYRAPSARTDDGVIAGVVGLVVLALGGIGFSSYLRHRKRNCAHCGRPMQRLDESADNVHLDSGRQLEEVLGSVDYDVWQCTGCSHHQVLPYPAMFSGKKDCPSCNYKTVEVTTTVLEHPTYDHAGRQRVENAAGATRTSSTCRESSAPAAAPAGRSAPAGALPAADGPGVAADRPAEAADPAPGAAPAGAGNGRQERGLRGEGTHPHVAPEPERR